MAFASGHSRHRILAQAGVLEPVCRGQSRNVRDRIGKVGGLTHLGDQDQTFHQVLHSHAEAGDKDSRRMMAAREMAVQVTRHRMAILGEQKPQLQFRPGQDIQIANSE
jgi:hypothetical protein